jgi:hypothetical protein
VKIPGKLKSRTKRKIKGTAIALPVVTETYTIKAPHKSYRTCEGGTIGRGARPRSAPGSGARDHRDHRRGQGAGAQTGETVQEGREAAMTDTPQSPRRSDT